MAQSRADQRAERKSPSTTESAVWGNLQLHTGIISTTGRINERSLPTDCGIGIDLRALQQGVDGVRSKGITAVTTDIIVCQQPGLRLQRSLKGPTKK
jgi:hypothetical protein